MQLQTQPDIAEYRLLTSRLASVRFHKLSEPGCLHAFVCTRFAETWSTDSTRSTVYFNSGSIGLFCFLYTDPSDQFSRPAWIFYVSRDEPEVGEFTRSEIERGTSKFWDSTKGESKSDSIERERFNALYGSTIDFYTLTCPRRQHGSVIISKYQLQQSCKVAKLYNHVWWISLTGGSLVTPAGLKRVSSLIYYDIVKLRVAFLHVLVP